VTSLTVAQPRRRTTRRSEILEQPTSGKEIERKFLVREAPAKLDDYPITHITQGYLAYEAGKSQVRVRRTRDERYSSPEYYLTAKRRAGLVRDEVNVPLSKEAFDELWPLTAGRRLSKRRYHIPLGRLEIELDVFEGVRTGLILAELEFGSEAAAHRFVPPVGLGREVTKDPAYRNVVLAVE
jgi:CYTH domain-containing protein